MSESIRAHVEAVCAAAKEASRTYGSTDTASKNALLSAMADRLMADRDCILEANAKDLSLAAENGVPATMLDRLKLTEARLASI